MRLACSNLADARLMASRAGFDVCQTCPRHPRHGNTVFAVGCPTHQSEAKPLVLFIVRDPSSPQREGVVGCSGDAHVCPWCHTDQSAINFREKIYPEFEKLAPMMGAGKNGRYPAYFLNCVFHGPERNAHPPSGAIRSCTHVVKLHIKLLRPQIVMALGLEAQKSLRLIVGQDIGATPVTKDGTYYLGTFHPGAQSYNHKKAVIHKDFRTLARIVSSEGGDGELQTNAAMTLGQE